MLVVSVSADVHACMWPQQAGAGVGGSARGGGCGGMVVIVPHVEELRVSTHDQPDKETIELRMES